MKKSVTSKDPRKPAIMAAFKRAVEGCTKVTMVTDLGGGFFLANCLGKHAGHVTYATGQRTGGFAQLGSFELVIEVGES